MHLIDTHCHLNDSRFADDLDDVLERASQAGIRQLLVAGYDRDSCERGKEMATKYGVWVAFGVHPHDASSVEDRPNWLDEIRRDLIETPCVAAAGEMGLDFHYNFSPAEIQEIVFRQQISLAEELNLPATIHSRAAEDRVMDILEEMSPPRAGAVLHAFTGSSKQAERAVKMGLYIGVTGMVTFKKTDELRQMVLKVPLNRLLIETDCPYLAPVPHRGKRNEPAYLPHIVSTLAEMYCVSEMEVAEHTTSNAYKVFSRMRE